MKKGEGFTYGGVIPPDGKRYTCDVPIRNAPVPASAVIAMHQHMGDPARCAVNAGDAVREGMRIGEASGAFSANVHSSIPGVVREVGSAFLPSGLAGPAVTVDLEGFFDHSGRGAARPVGPAGEWEGMPVPELIRRVWDRGIVGLGGVAFPTVLKLTGRKGSRVETFVVNGVECEPFLTADHRLMLEKTDEILKGVAIVRALLSPRRVLAAVAADRPDAIERLASRAPALGLDLEVVPVEPRYPQGDERLLLQALTGREIPSGGGPLDVGAVVANVGTLFAIYEAVMLDKPLIERVVTVSGSIVRRPANLKVRLGTPVRELIEECGGFSEPPVRLIAGGPMMGFALMDLDAPITKGTAGVIALSRREVPRGAQTPCIGCGRCVSSCPQRLRPTILYKWVDHGEYELAEREGLADCTECGCCGYVCPARIPLVQGLKLGRATRQRMAAG